MDNEQFEQNDKRIESVFSSKIRAGKRRTYFFDVRATRGNDYFLTITESRKRFDNSGYDRHKIFLYKEDFNKFLKAVNEAVDFVKTDLMPDFDFDAFNHDEAFAADNYVTSPAPIDPEVLVENVAELAHQVEQTTTIAEPEQDIDISSITEKKPLEARDSSASIGDNLSGEEVDKW
jgi:hypothetical protein